MKLLSPPPPPPPTPPSLLAVFTSSPRFFHRLPGFTLSVFRSCSSVGNMVKENIDFSLTRCLAWLQLGRKRVIDQMSISRCLIYLSEWSWKILSGWLWLWKSLCQIYNGWNRVVITDKGDRVRMHVRAHACTLMDVHAGASTLVLNLHNRIILSPAQLYSKDLQARRLSWVDAAKIGGTLLCRFLGTTDNKNEHTATPKPKPKSPVH